MFEGEHENMNTKCHVEGKWWISSMSTWMTTRMHAKSTMVDPKMHGDNTRDGKRTEEKTL